MSTFTRPFHCALGAILISGYEIKSHRPEAVKVKIQSCNQLMRTNTCIFANGQDITGEDIALIPQDFYVVICS